MSIPHLHVHTTYSFNDPHATASIPELAAAAKKHNIPAMAITDHGFAFGAAGFIRECQKAGIKPIIGCEVYVAGEDGELSHLTLLCENNLGYENLIRLTVESVIRSYPKTPAISKELLRKYNKGLIALSGCFGGEVGNAGAADS